MAHTSLSLIALWVLLTAPVASAQMPRIELTAGFYRIDAEVAANEPNRAQGLMHRRSMNTYLPLSVAFLDQEGRILNIENMQPETEDNHCAAKAARFALEMNLGWFSSKGIKPGARIGGIEKSPAPQ
jgi:uncharacterized membrane protein (UPF0127 family)